MLLHTHAQPIDFTQKTYIKINNNSNKLCSGCVKMVSTKEKQKTKTEEEEEKVLSK